MPCARRPAGFDRWVCGGSPQLPPPSPASRSPAPLLCRGGPAPRQGISSKEALRMPRLAILPPRPPRAHPLITPSAERRTVISRRIAGPPAGPAHYRGRNASPWAGPVPPASLACALQPAKSLRFRARRLAKGMGCRQASGPLTTRVDGRCAPSQRRHRALRAVRGLAALRVLRRSRAIRGRELLNSRDVRGARREVASGRGRRTRSS